MGGTTPLGSVGLIRPRLRRFQELKRHRIRHILLVSSLYDSFILSEDGLLNEALLKQFIDLNLGQNPDLVRVASGTDAISMAVDQQRFDLIITNIHVGDMDAVELVQRVRQAGLKIPVLLMAYNNRELTEFMAHHDLSGLDRVFIWQGDSRIMMAMVSYIEDKLDVEHDTGNLGVPAIILVEDNVHFYSSFLPVIYSELMNHTHGLIGEGLNLSHKMLRMRARPKVLLCSSFEEAWDCFERYEEHVLGVITDIEFPWEGKQHKQAGVELATRIRAERFDVPIVLQSSIPDNAQLAESIEAMFLLKGSPLLLKQLREVLVRHFGFGDFVFRRPDGQELGRAHDLKSLIEMIRTVPDESIIYHGERHHFSSWLKARTEFALAGMLRGHTVAEFESPQQLRDDLIQVLTGYRSERDRTVVADFDERNYDNAAIITRIGGGSLGGKARGLAFINRLLTESYLPERFPEIDVLVPSAVVLGTDFFDQFMDQDGLRQFAVDADEDEEIRARFLGAPFPEEAIRPLRVFLEGTHCPLAVRSSGLLEDSPNQPFAGIYDTYMLPNNDPDPEIRLIQLIAAAKLVYSSTFYRRSKGYLHMTSYRLEEEKMAVIIQQLVGTMHAPRYYPDFSGVARSHNFYPTGPMKSEDGVVAVALGMGKTVVDGGRAMRFSPSYPQHLPGFSSVDDVLENSQREFYALDLSSVPLSRHEEGAELTLYGLGEAEQDGPLSAVGSTYSPDNGVINDGIARPGVRLVTFAPILKQVIFPLAELLHELLEVGRSGTLAPVEIEFAGNLNIGQPGRPEFAILQMRPLALSSEQEELEIGEVETSSLVCRSNSVLGNGRISGVSDIVMVDYEDFDRLRSREVAHGVARFNGELEKAEVPYLLIGLGRWGSADPNLGIPVTWNQISGARVIIESGFRDMKVTPSQGSHFFQNISSFGIGYFTVNSQAGEGFIDWGWLSEQDVVSEFDSVRHIRLDRPLDIKINGQLGEGVILKPDS